MSFRRSHRKFMSVGVRLGECGGYKTGPLVLSIDVGSESPESAVNIADEMIKVMSIVHKPHAAVLRVVIGTFSSFLSDSSVKNVNRRLLRVDTIVCKLLRRECQSFLPKQ
jgi:hypothetical protein